MFEKYKILHGLPSPGQKVKYSKETKFAFFQKVVENAKLLKLGDYYTVKKTQLNSSSTYVWLEEFSDDKFFSMHSFTWDLPEVNLDDLIGLGVRSVCKLNNSYGYGIKFDNKVLYEGTPMLVLEYNEYDEVTKAYYED